ncbi:prepilin peptidase [Virgibacillus alimentarius]|uniref:Leader peptidase (Prepilin peptidase)/N-methyltransferase n=1 Tax=Virgibacillus alimentarius TaxID=698769 RepID=A0ABS4SAL9_9BACI|nr:MULTISPECIES: A24 family peptidase [Virgibacillus]MBP2258550.1 leader peptidase (prepilin peptidase)/N-methyltransferase [Virgibacillus alimentarius]HLR68457.1 prepilin peptidase [Virgibacillus sp.]
MEVLVAIFFFIFGLVFGSFFNVVGLRLPVNKNFSTDFSICPNCKHRLSWIDLIPVLSFIIQRSKCRYCKSKVSYIYPMGETVTGILFTVSYLKFGFTLELITALLIVSMLMIILISDLTFMVIPNKVLLFFLPLFTIAHILQPLHSWWASIVGALIPFGMIAIIIIVSRGGMGAGDMKLFGVLGFILGLEKTLLTFFLSCLIGAIVSTLLLFLNILKRKQPFPFGPYIIIGTLISYFYGNEIITWYVNLLFPIDTQASLTA